MKDAGLKFNLRAAAAKFWSLHLARPRRDPPTRRLPAGSLHRRILAHKSQGKWCTRRTPFFILRCAWKRLEERAANQPYYSHEAQFPEELTARSDSRRSPKPGPLTALHLRLSATGASFDFALTQSVSQWSAELRIILFWPCAI
jgi:hypothetical protein